MNKIIPINIDRAVTSKYFEDPNVLHVTSIFRTLQGEGPFTGHPAVFVRLAGCNFGAKNPICEFCDTDFRIDRARIWDISTLARHINQIAHKDDIIVITGGEPTLQAEPLIKLMMDLEDEGYPVQIETNGTQAPFFTRLTNSYDLGYLNIDMTTIITSPKANKVGEYTKPPFEVFRGTDNFKFLVSADPQSPYHRPPSWAGVQGTYVSPMAVYARAYEGEISSIWDDDLLDRKATAANYAYAAQLALDMGYKLSLQTHLFTAIP